MSGNYSLTSRFAVAMAVLFLLSIGLCGLGATGVVHGNPDLLVPAGLIALGLSVVAFVLTIIFAIVESIKVKRMPDVPAITPPPPSPPPPPPLDKPLP